MKIEIVTYAPFLEEILVVFLFVLMGSAFVTEKITAYIKRDELPEKYIVSWVRVAMGGAGVVALSVTNVYIAMVIGFSEISTGIIVKTKERMLLAFVVFLILSVAKYVVLLKVKRETAKKQGYVLGVVDVLVLCSIILVDVGVSSGFLMLIGHEIGHIAFADLTYVTMTCLVMTILMIGRYVVKGMRQFR